MSDIKNFVKKYKWYVAAGLALLLVLVVLLFIKLFEKDAMFYEVKCVFPDEEVFYSFIVDDKLTAKEFKKDMQRTNDEYETPLYCSMVSYDKASNDTLFVYAITTVLNDVVFAIKEDYVGKDFYQVQFFDSDDDVAALSCQYKDARFDCYNELPEDPVCPETEVEAQLHLADKCNYKETTN